VTLSADTAPTPPSAPLLNDRYRPTRLIADGGSARVFQGKDVLLRRDVAIKVFHTGTPEQIEAYREELRMLASLGHHGIVHVVDAGIDESLPSDPRPFLVMELIRGQTVRALIQGGKLTGRDIGGIGFEVAEALDYVHSRGVIHRDVTPANILLVDYGTGSSRPRARITDFGIAVAHDGVANGMTVGTAPYLSPEQALGRPLTGATDVYSLGLVLLEAFTGRPEFPGATPEEIGARLTRDPVIGSDIPLRWRGLLVDMTVREPAARPSPAEVLDRLRLILRREKQ